MKEEKTYIENGYAYVLQKQRNDGYLYDSGVCLSKSLAYEMRENKECDYVEEVPIFGSEQDKELLDKLKNPPQFEPFNSDLFTEKIAETANKTAQVSHDLEMKRIKAKLIADLCKELVKTPIRYEDVPKTAREIAEKALETATENANVSQIAKMQQQIDTFKAALLHASERILHGNKCNLVFMSPIDETDRALIRNIIKFIDERSKNK